MGPLFWPWTRVVPPSIPVLKKLKKNQKNIKNTKKTLLLKKEGRFSTYLFACCYCCTEEKRKKPKKNQDAKCSRCSNYGGQSRPHHKSRCPGSNCSWWWSTSSARSSSTQSKWGFVPYGLSLRRRFGQGCH